MKILQRLSARLPAVLASPNRSGQQIVIHIPPGGNGVRIEWPSEVEEVRQESG